MYGHRYEDGTPKNHRASCEAVGSDGKSDRCERGIENWLIPEIIDDDRIEEHAERFLREFVSGTSKKAVEFTKEILSQVKDLTLEDALKYGAMMNAKARSTEDFKKGLEAFLNKKHLEWE